MDKKAYSPKQLIIITYSVLIGLTPLIPIPVVDDWIAGYFRRLFVKNFGESYGLKLNNREITILISGKSTITKGCLNVLLFPLKTLLFKWIRKFIRELLYFLEIRRAINLITNTYYYGYLLGYAFDHGWYQPGSEEIAERLYTAIQLTPKGANTRLVKNVVKTTFSDSKQLVFEASSYLAGFMKTFVGDVVKTGSRLGKRLWSVISFPFRIFRSRRNKHPGYQEPFALPASVPPPEMEKELNQIYKNEFTNKPNPIKRLVQILQTGIGNVPQEHFKALEDRLNAEMIRLSQF